MIKKQFGGYYNVDDGRVSGSGVLLLTYDVAGTIPSIVLIHSKSKHALEEPGGGSHGKTKTKDYGNVLDTARRELFEETAGLIDARSVSMYRYYMDTPVRRNQKNKWYYRTYFMHVDGINRYHFHYNYNLLRKNTKTPKEYLETNELIIVPLRYFRKIKKVGNEFVISIDGQLIPVSKRLKRIMNHGGIELAAKVLLETRPKKANRHWVEHKKGFMKGAITLVV